MRVVSIAKKIWKDTTISTWMWVLLVGIVSGHKLQRVKMSRQDEMAWNCVPLIFYDQSHFQKLSKNFSILMCLIMFQRFHKSFFFCPTPYHMDHMIWAIWVNLIQYFSMFDFHASIVNTKTLELIIWRIIWRSATPRKTRWITIEIAKQ